MARNGLVQIRREDDSLVMLPIALLQPDDRNWIDHRMADIRRTAETLALVRPDLDPGDEPSSRIVSRRTFGGNRFLEPATGSAGLRLLAIASGVPSSELFLAHHEMGGNQVNVALEPIPDIARAFETFVKLKAIRTHWDDRYFYVESRGIPEHQMMVGIRSWQQQVPIPQKYFGDNAWQIPLHPVPAHNPRSANGNFLRGAIALAVNGVPIFNPLNNRGDDAYLFGELDEFGGHCGRADDYHYHLAPVHLEKINGKSKPVAYALDGYPIYGYNEPDGSPVRKLDAFNGHEDANGNYHYHATAKYPYLNGGFHGEVTERGGQVDPQPRAEPIRPDLRPLRGARITDFRETKPGSYVLTYDVRGREGTVSYTLGRDGSARFVFVDTNGNTRSETYSPRRRAPGGRDRRPPPRDDDRPPPRDDDRPPPRDEDRPPPRDEDRPPPRDGDQPPHRDKASLSRSNLPQLVVTSSSADAQGLLSIDCTCDGKGVSPAVAWKNVPPGTKSFAVSLWHTAPDREKSYWVVYNIPANVGKLEQNAKSVGTLGLNDRREAAYDPMCSKGPGLKTYHITVFALSSELKLAPTKATRANLLAAIQNIALAEGTLDVQYERKGQR